MRENLRLFLPDHSERHETLMKKKIRKFILAFKLLQEFISIHSDPNHPDSLEFYSSFYVDTSKILTEITCFLISSGLAGKRRRIDNAISISQKILGLLKILHERYIITISSTDPLDDSRWDEITHKSNSDIVEEISILFERMYRNEGWVITHSFFFEI